MDIKASCSVCGSTDGSCAHQAGSCADNVHPAEAQQAAASGSLLGKTIAGRFEVLEELGAGGMGTVYKARHILINKLVAVKVLHPLKALDSKAARRFHQEAKAASALGHGNLISVSDFGLLSSGEPFIVMDLIEGESLGDRIRQKGPLDWSEAVRIFTQVCDGLEHAHSRAVIHRDMKPSNIMLVPAGAAAPHVRIVDFGIAKFDSAETGAQELTETGEVFGSPLFMSPEQCAGKKLDARTDLYSFGCVMYETLVGQPPFRGENPLQTMYMHAHDKPASIRSLRPQVPADLEAIVMRLLEKDPKRRYQSAHEIKTQLQQLSTKRFYRPRQSALVAVVLAGAFAVAGWQLLPVLRTKLTSIANGAQTQSKGQPDILADPVQDQIDDDVNAASGAATRAWNGHHYLQAEKIMLGALASARSKHMQDPKDIRLGFMYGGLGLYNYSQGKYKPAEGAWLSGAEFFHHLNGISPEQTRKIVEALANFYDEQRDFNKAVVRWVEASENWQRMEQFNAAQLADLPRLITSCRKRIDESNLELQTANVDDDFIRRYRNERSKAESALKTYQEELKERQELAMEYQEHQAEASWHAAFDYSRLARQPGQKVSSASILSPLETALKSYARLEKLQRFVQSVGVVANQFSDDPTISSLETAQAVVDMAARVSDRSTLKPKKKALLSGYIRGMQARNLHQQASLMRSDAQLKVKDSGQLAKMLSNAVELMKESAELLKNDDPKASVQAFGETASYMLDLASITNPPDSDRLSDAAKLAKQAIGICVKERPDDYQQQYFDWFTVAQSAILAKDWKNAESARWELLKLAQKLYGQTSKDTAVALTDLAYAEGQQKEYDKADEHFEQALKIEAPLAGGVDAEMQTLAAYVDTLGRQGKTVEQTRFQARLDALKIEKKPSH